jgi:hypothetical protein
MGKINSTQIKILDIGCGKQKVPGSIGVDFNDNFSPDVVHNLNHFPYPFEDDEFDEVYILSTLFLLENAIRVMEEVYRISKINAKVVILQPYFRSVWNYVDPWVKNFGTVHSFAFYDPNDPICKRYQYTTARFITVSILFDEIYENPRYLRKIIIKIANRFPRKYEIYLSHFFPLDMIQYTLKKI